VGNQRNIGELLFHWIDEGQKEESLAIIATNFGIDIDDKVRYKRFRQTLFSLNMWLVQDALTSVYPYAHEFYECWDIFNELVYKSIGVKTPFKSWGLKMKDVYREYDYVLLKEGKKGALRELSQLVSRNISGKASDDNSHQFAICEYIQQFRLRLSKYFKQHKMSKSVVKRMLERALGLFIGSGCLIVMIVVFVVGFIIVELIGVAISLILTLILPIVLAVMVVAVIVHAIVEKHRSRNKPSEVDQ